MNVSSNFSDEAWTWTNCGLTVEALSSPCFRWDLHQPKCAGWDSVFTRTLIVLCFHACSWDLISVSAQEDTAFLGSITCSLWTNKCQSTVGYKGSSQRLCHNIVPQGLEENQQLSPFHPHYWLRGIVLVQGLATPLWKDGNISLSVLVINLSWCKAAVFWMLRGY